MLNFIWAGMIVIGVVYATLQGNVSEVTDVALESAKEAVSLCLTMVGVMALWTGLMEIATKAGIIEGLSRLLRPAIRWMFPNIPKGHKANRYITTNIVANMLGLGWAATPAARRGSTSSRCRMRMICKKDRPRISVGGKVYTSLR